MSGRQVFHIDTDVTATTYGRYGSDASDCVTRYKAYLRIYKLYKDTVNMVWFKVYINDTLYEEIDLSTSGLYTTFSSYVTVQDTIAIEVYVRELDTPIAIVTGHINERGFVPATLDSCKPTIKNTIKNIRNYRTA